MNREEKIEVIRQRVKQFVPEILEPKFGCVVIAEANGHEYIFVRQREAVLDCYDPSTNAIIDFLASDLEVKGRPIHFTDVQFTISTISSDMNSLLPAWDLRFPDDIREQPEHTLDTIITLLGI